MVARQKTPTGRGRTSGADRDRKHEAPAEDRGHASSRDRNHAVATPSPDDRRGGEGQDARVSERDQRQGRRTKDVVRDQGESGYAEDATVPDR